MKLDPIFTVKNNQLVKIEDNSTPDISTFKKIEVKWSTVEIQEEAYNEEFLAQLREDLKILDETSKFAIIIPVADKELTTPEQIELFINAFNHTARRIKDCVSVAGMELPSQLLSGGLNADSPVAEFIETLGKKHAQYVYFATSENVKNANLDNEIQNSDIVIY